MRVGGGAVKAPLCNDPKSPACRLRKRRTGWRAIHVGRLVVLAAACRMMEAATVPAAHPMEEA